MDTLYNGANLYEWIMIIFMSCMFGSLIWNIQKWLEREPVKDYTDFIGRMQNGETLHSCNMFGEPNENSMHYYYDWSTCAKCGYRMYGDQWYEKRGLA